MNYTGQIPSLCTRFHLQNGNNISSHLCKVFWDLLVKKKTPRPKQTELVSSLEFHESTACKLCASISLNTLCSWLWHHYSTWSKWSKIISSFLCNTSDFFHQEISKYRRNSWCCSHCRLLSRLPSPLSTQLRLSKVRNTHHHPPQHPPLGLKAVEQVCVCIC